MEIDRSILVHGRLVGEGSFGLRASDLPESGILIQENRIVEIGTFSQLKQKFPQLPVQGDANTLVIPGLVNAHHHVGLTPFQLGVPDLPLELWGAARMGCPAIEPYLDTLYGALHMVKSGITTVQHILPLFRGSLPQLQNHCDAVIQAYRDVGMRLSFSINIRDQNRLWFEPDEITLQKVAPALRQDLAAYINEISFDLDEYLACYDYLIDKYQADDMVAIQIAPANLHWLSDRALHRIQEFAARRQLKLHMHILETNPQRRYADGRNSAGAISHLHDYGLLTSEMTLGHAVWVDDKDIDLISSTGAHICHNCSSNLRLGSGKAPLSRFLDAGINIALGIDEAGINDDHDMLQEMRIAWLTNRDVTNTHPSISGSDILHMATLGGARTTPFSGRIGKLETGYLADLVLVDTEKLFFPYPESELPVSDVIVQRAKNGMIKNVICNGKLIENSNNKFWSLVEKIPHIIKNLNYKTLRNELFSYIKSKEFYS